MNTKKYNLIFIGTPDFSVPTLQALISNERFNISAVITAPDAKVGRKQILTPPPIKIIAQKHKLSVLQPKKITSVINQITKLSPDVIVVIAYGQIIPKAILDIPKFGCLNLHASLLPKYRGASPIQAAILNGDKKTGITLMKMDAGLDTGPLITQESIDITATETGESLHNKLAKLSAATLVKYLPQYLDGKLKEKPQDNSRATHTKKITRESGKINWRKSAKEIARMTRAYYPWPGTWCKWNNKILKIISVDIIKINKYTTGAVFLHPPRIAGEAGDGQLAMQCGKNALIIKKLQLEGKKQMSNKEFLAGHQEIIGIVLK